jgi:hypothetical protein
MPLIPANAGIQQQRLPRIELWIPACAGMSGEKFIGCVTLKHPAVQGYCYCSRRMTCPPKRISAKAERAEPTSRARLHMPLIPANAGIQRQQLPRDGLWIPACAGMSGGRLIAFDTLEAVAWLDFNAA